MSRACRKADVGDAVRDEQSEAPGIGRAADTLFEEEPVEDQLAARRAARVKPDRASDATRPGCRSD